MQAQDICFFTVRGKCFAYDVHSTACTQLEPVALTVLPELIHGNGDGLEERLSGLCPRPQLKAAIRQCRQLLDSGVFGGPRKRYRHRIQDKLLGLCLHVAHRCNLRCAYCYADAGSFGRERRLMTSQVLRKAIDFGLQHTARRANLDIGFFGGEPLLNFARIREGVEYARRRAVASGKRVSFSMTSNATLLTPEIMEFLVTERFSLIFSLDGPAAIHDRMRRTAGGSATHAQALRNILTYQKKYGGHFTVRGTFTRLTPDFSRQVLFLNRMGFPSVSVEPSQIAASDPLSISAEADMVRIKLEYDKLADIYLDRFRQGRPLTFFHFDHALRKLLNPQPAQTQCGAGGGYVAITPAGDVYPCFEMVVEEENRIGTLDTGFNVSKRREFQKMHANVRRGCKSCWLRNHCGGGCHAFNVRFNGDIHEPYRPNCELTEHRFKLSAWILSEIFSMGSKAVKALHDHVGIS